MGNLSKLHWGTELGAGEFGKCLLQFSSESCKVKFTTVTSWMRWNFSLVFDWFEGSVVKQWYMWLQTLPCTYLMNANEYASDQYTISAQNTVQLSHPHAAIMHSTLPRYPQKLWDSYFYHNSTVPRVIASTAQHCMNTKEKVPSISHVPLPLPTSPLSQLMYFLDYKIPSIIRYNLHLTMGFQK